MFGFNYQLECYLPRAKRRFGYFSLPLFSTEGFCGLIDARVDRKAAILRIEHLHLLKRFNGDGRFENTLTEALELFAAGNSVQEVVVLPEARRVWDSFR